MNLEKLLEGLKIGVKSALSNIKHLSSRLWAAVTLFAMLNLIAASNFIVAVAATVVGIIAVGMAYSDKEDSEALEEEMANEESKSMPKADDKPSDDSSDEGN